MIIATWWGNRGLAAPMALDPALAAQFGPAAVAIHDDSDMMGQPGSIQAV